MGSAPSKVNQRCHSEERSDEESTFALKNRTSRFLSLMRDRNDKTKNNQERRTNDNEPPKMNLEEKLRQLRQATQPTARDRDLVRQLEYLRRRESGPKKLPAHRAGKGI